MVNATTSGAFRAPVSLAAVFALGLLILPAAGFAGATPAGSLDRANLTTAEDFLEYASINDVNIHELYFGTILYEGTESCLMCHEKEAQAVLDMGHFKWEGKVANIAGLEGQVFGKNQLLNNFCIAVPSNEGRCTQCHAGVGYADKNFDFGNPANIDCLACHDQSGTYKKGLTTAGAPDPSVDLNVVARSIALGSTPTRKNCIDCHAGAGGGDNVKHGDLSTDLVSTTREYDVHMGTDGANLQCVNCHSANHDPKSGDYNHGNAGMSLHSVHEGEMRQCADCHGDRVALHSGTSIEEMLAEGKHDRLACQVCHIPAIARKISTKVEWYWSEAGQDITPPIDPDTGRPTYDKKKGSFVWKNNVRPTLRYSNGKWNRMIIGVSDRYQEEPVQLATPLGSYSDPDAMIYPFKLMVGNQPVDAGNQTVLVPHLFGSKGGPNPYWAKYDWNLALKDGAAYAGQEYTGKYAFADTEMLLSVNHEIAPAEQALGMGGFQGCLDCHDNGLIDWQALGWTDNPAKGGQRIEAIGATLLEKPQDR